MTEVDLERVRMLTRQLHTALGLDADQMPKKPTVTETRYEEVAGGTHVIDLDADGNEVSRQFVPERVITRGLKSTED